MTGEKDVNLTKGNIVGARYFSELQCLMARIERHGVLGNKKYGDKRQHIVQTWSSKNSVCLSTVRYDKIGKLGNHDLDIEGQKHNKISNNCYS